MEKHFSIIISRDDGHEIHLDECYSEKLCSVEWKTQLISLVCFIEMRMGCSFKMFETSGITKKPSIRVYRLLFCGETISYKLVSLVGRLLLCGGTLVRSNRLEERT